ncbi:MAG TPA: hypothetical protein VGO18_01720 [Steroidobacteraceae bacterium]|nr:hypothetical protein [Steroidobacteraceae bacterium]
MKDNERLTATTLDIVNADVINLGETAQRRMSRLSLPGPRANNESGSCCSGC